MFVHKCNLSEWKWKVVWKRNTQVSTAQIPEESVKYSNKAVPLGYLPPVGTQSAVSCLGHVETQINGMYFKTFSFNHSVNS